MSHAKFPPSAAHRWLECTASPRLEAAYPGEEGRSDAADRGTCYHAMAESTITWLFGSRIPVRRPTPKQIRLAVLGAYGAIRTCGDGVSISAPEATRLTSWDECEALVLPYVQYISDQFFLSMKRGPWWGAETRMNMSHLGAQCWGTVDYWCYADSVLDIVDLKTGRHPVSPDNNVQLMLYALGALALLPADKDEPSTLVRLHIHQGGEAQVWSTCVEDMILFQQMVTLALAEAQTGGQMAAGEHCRWCLAKRDCPEFSGHGLMLAKTEFAPAKPDMKEEQIRQTLDTMPAQTITSFLNRYREIEVFMQVATEVLADKCYREGLDVPGYKVIRQTKHKAWKDKKEAETLLREKHGNKVVKETLVTPNQAIKLLGEEALAGLWETPVGALKLVPESARGQAVTANAASEFADGTTNTE